MSEDSSTVQMSNTKTILRRNVVPWSKRMTCNSETTVEGLPSPIRMQSSWKQELAAIEKKEKLKNAITKTLWVNDRKKVHYLASLVENTSSDSEDPDEDESIPEDCARVVCTNLFETTEKINDIEVLDRGFLHGDIVATTSDPSGLASIMVNVDLKVDLLTPTSTTIKYISRKKLQRIRAFAVGDYVIHGHWLGKVDEVVDNVTTVFDDGSKCKLMKADLDRLIPISKNILEDTHYPYFPRQLVRYSSSTVFKNAQWLCGAWKANHMEGTIRNILSEIDYLKMDSSIASIPEEFVDGLVNEFVYDPIQLPLTKDSAHILYNCRTLEKIWDNKQVAVNPYTRQPFDIHNAILQTEMKQHIR